MDKTQTPPPSTTHTHIPESLLPPERDTTPSRPPLTECQAPGERETHSALQRQRHRGIMASSHCNADTGLEIKTRSVEQTLIPLVTQVCLGA